jgi:hypothetical protein
LTVATLNARALAIADRSMFERLDTEAVAHDDFRTVLGLTDEDQQEVARLADASQAMQEAVAWLIERGYVEMAEDTSGEYVNVIRRPGEDEDGTECEESQDGAPAAGGAGAGLSAMVEAAGMVSALDNGSGSCVYSDGCAGVTQEHLERFAELVRADVLKPPNAGLSRPQQAEET